MIIFAIVLVIIRAAQYWKKTEFAIWKKKMLSIFENNCSRSILGGWGCICIEQKKAGKMTEDCLCGSFFEGWMIWDKCGCSHLSILITQPTQTSLRSHKVSRIKYLSYSLRVQSEAWHCVDLHACSSWYSILMSPFISFETLYEEIKPTAHRFIQ